MLLKLIALLNFSFRNLYFVEAFNMCVRLKFWVF